MPSSNRVATCLSAGFGSGRAKMGMVSMVPSTCSVTQRSPERLVARLLRVVTVAVTTGVGQATGQTLQVEGLRC